jgi:hypothetical protein
MQKAHPDPQVLQSSFGHNGKDETPTKGGIGHGKGGTDKATVAKLYYRPEFSGLTEDDRTRKGER